MYGGTSGVQLLERVRKGDYKMPRHLNPAIPRELDAILLKALAKDRDQRFQTASEFRDALAEYLEEHRLQLSRQWLAEFINELFSKSIQIERQQLAEEFKLAEDLRPDAAPTQPGPKKTPMKVASERTVRVSLEELEAIKKESSGPKPIPSQVQTEESKQTDADRVETDLTPAPPVPEPPSPEPSAQAPEEPPKSEAPTRGEIPSVKSLDETAILPPPREKPKRPEKKPGGALRVVLYIVMLLLYGGLVFLLYSYFDQLGWELF
jgi:serine/threonine protein kinase